MDVFDSLVMDLLGDAGIYMSDAAAKMEKPCPDCEVTGETALPNNDHELAMQMLAALARDMGGSSTVPVAGEGDLGSVGRPGRLVIEPWVIRQVGLPAAVDVHHVDFIGAIPFTGEGDLRSVR